MLFVAVIGEIALRLGDLRVARQTADPRCAGAEAVQDGQRGVFQLDDAAGYVTRPNLCIRFRTDEYDSVLRTNSRGLAGPDLPATKPDGEFRVVVLGDSYTAGGQVPYEQSFTALLEQRLQESGHPNVRVVNVAVGGWTTFNEAGYLRENLSWLQPDLVVVASFLGNDVGENVLVTRGGYRLIPEHPKGFGYGQAASDLLQESFGWFPRNGPAPPGISAPGDWNPPLPLPTPVPNGSAAAAERTYVPPQPGPRTRVLNWAKDSWESARGASRLLGALFGTPADRSTTTAPGARPPAAEQRKINISNFEWLILRDRPRAYWLDVAWPLLGTYLSDVQATAASVGAPTMMLVVPQIAQFDESERARTMADFRFTWDEVDWERPQREIAAQAATAGVQVVDLLPRFSARSDRGDLYFQSDQHFSALGHVVVADELAAAIQPRIPVRQGAPQS